MLRYKLYVDDALEMIDRIEKLGSHNLDVKENWDATLMRLQVIGESVKKIPKEVKKKYKGIKWEKFENLRDFISHTYMRVPLDIVKNIIEVELPNLKLKLEVLEGDIKRDK